MITRLISKRTRFLSISTIVALLVSLLFFSLPAHAVVACDPGQKATYINKVSGSYVVTGSAHATIQRSIGLVNGEQSEIVKWRSVGPNWTLAKASFDFFSKDETAYMGIYWQPSFQTPTTFSHPTADQLRLKTGLICTQQV